ncbi:ubiquitin carboxyl-terminal hydrolase 8 isoform X2 [Lampetra fluviatilis]
MPVLTEFSNKKPLHVCASLGELNSLAQVKIEKTKSPRGYAQSASKVLKKAEEYGLERDEENAYMLYMRFLHIVDHLRKTPEFLQDKGFFLSMLGSDNFSKAVREAERLSESLKNRYEEAEVRQRLEERERVAKEDAAFRDEGVGDDDYDDEDDDDNFNRRHGPLGNGTATGGTRPPETRKRRSGSPGSRSQPGAEVVPTESNSHTGPCRTSITPQQLYSMLSGSDVQLVLMDARPSIDYAASHIMSVRCISVPEEAINPGTTVAQIEVGLPQESLSLWGDRGRVDYVLLLDWRSRPEDVLLGTTLHSLRDAIYKWDSMTILRSQPLVLEGGYENWLLHYPMWCSEPHVHVPARPGPPSTQPDLLELNYPSLEEPPPPPTPAPPPAPPPTVRDVGSSTLVAGVRPEPEQSGGGATASAAASAPGGSLDALPSGLPTAAAKSIPQVDRSKKPAVATAGPSPVPARATGFAAAAVPGPERLSAREREEIARDAAGIKEKARVEKEKRMKAEEVRKRRAAEEEEKRKWAEEEKRKTEERRKLEDEERARKDHVERTRRARLEKEEKEKDRAVPSPAIGSAKESPPPHSPDVRAERLRQQQEEAENRQREEAERVSRIREKAEQDQRGRMQDGRMGPSRHTPDSHTDVRPTQPAPTARTAATQGGERDRPRLQRSFSSPNVAQLGMDIDEEDERTVVDGGPRPKPQFDRASKPVPAAVVRAQSSAILPMRHLNPTYGGMGRALTGLRNLGNTCYMNSVVQCLSNTTSLAEYFLTSQYVNNINRNNPLGRKGQVVEEFAVIVRALWSGQYRSITPRDFKFMIGRLNDQFCGTEQHDSQELLIFLLDGLHEDLNQAKRVRVKEEKTEHLSDSMAAKLAWDAYKHINESVLVTLFHGQFRSTIKCLTCQKVSRTFEVFMNLTLHLPSDTTSKCTLQDCLQMFSKPEKMTDANRYLCSHCKQRRESVKTMEIWRLPPVLIIHLKRFSYSGRWKQKLQTNVGFPLTSLNMKPYIINKENRYSEYNLYAVSNHYGSLDGGHYTAYAHNTVRDSWFKFDDHEVEFIYPKNVSTSAGYILFYSALPQQPPRMDIF